MELRIKPVTIPEAIEFNFEEIKQELTEKVAHYKTLVYTDDQVKDAKSDVANLRKFAKALSDERIRVKNQCLAPYEAFAAKVDELTKIVNEPIFLIDKQVKEFEDAQKQEKLNKIKETFEKMSFPDGIILEEIFESKWLNKSVSMKSIEDAMISAEEKIQNDLVTISGLPEYSFEARRVYISTLDLSKAVTEAHRLSEVAKRKAEWEAEQAKKKEEEEFAKQMNPPAESENAAVAAERTEEKSIPAQVEKQWVSFRCLLSVNDARSLGEFFKAYGIRYEQI